MDKALLSLPRLAVISLLLLIQLSGCATNPVSGKQDFVLVSESQEIDSGAQYHQQILQQYGVYDDPELQAYVNLIGQELAQNSHRSHLNFTFTILDSPEVNAFALPGGYIYITRGIMAYLNSEAELAGVLGHEIGHVTARHSVRQQSASRVTGLLGAVLDVATGQTSNGGLFSNLSHALTQGYGRDHELQADRLGAEYIARIGYEPENMIDVVSVLKNQELFEKELAQKEGRKPRTYHGVFASHPKNDKRLREVIQAARQFKTTKTRDINRNVYLQKISGMPFGSSAKDGIVRGNHFYHAELNAKLTLPNNWRVENFPDRLILIPKTNDALIQIKLQIRKDKQLSAKAVLENYLKSAPVSNTNDFSTNNLQGYTAVAVLDKTPFGKRPVRYSVLLREEYAWIFAATTKESVGLHMLDTVFNQVTNGLSSLKENEKKLAQPLRIKIIKADTNSTYQSLAKQSSLGIHAKSQLRLINADYPNAEPTPNELIKIVQ